MNLKRLLSLLILTTSIFFTPVSAQEQSLSDVLGQVEEKEFLDVDDAFQLSSDYIDGEVVIRWHIAPEYYLYNHQLDFKLKGAKQSSLYVPEGLAKTDQYFGDVQVYYQHLEVSLGITEPEDRFEVIFKYQGCADAGLCYTPETRSVSFIRGADGKFIQDGDFEKASFRESKTSSPSTTTDENFEGEREFLSRILSEGNLLWITLAFLGFGLLLTFTPCVLPMIPILSSIIAGQGANVTTAKAFKLSLVYVISMAVTYALFGILVAKAGGALSGYLQSPLVLFVVAGLFILLSLSMFGFYELQLPASIQNSLQAYSSKQKGGEYLSVVIMGVLATLVVSPCTSAPLAAALLLIAQKGDVATGGFALFMLGIGMGVPLLIIGSGGGKWLPKAGAWMDKVKAFFGYMLLGLALYITSHLLPGFVYLGLWAILLIHASFYFGAFKAADGGAAIVVRILSQGVFALGLVYLVGAFAGNSRLDNPLDGILSESRLSESHLTFQKFQSIEELDTILTAAKASNRGVMVDFFAEWCVACYEFEDYTFKDRDVQQFLKDNNILLLQIDVTENNESDTAIMKKYQVLGLPTILFIDSSGKELSNLRATGYENAEVFLKRLSAAFK